MQEDEEKYYLSLLFEALGQISELNERLHKLEKQFKELTSNHKNPTEVSLSNNNMNIPLSKLNIESELSDTVKCDIDRAVDFILKYGRNIPYINNK